MGGENEKKNMKYEGLWTCLVLPFHNRVEQACDLAGINSDQLLSFSLSLSQLIFFCFSFKPDNIFRSVTN